MARGNSRIVLVEEVKLRQGNMFSYRHEYDVLLVTTNAMVRKDGALVMGRGAALTATQYWPNLPFHLGRAIQIRPEYGVVVPGGIISGLRIGAFQVKHHWRDEANPDLIMDATLKLKTIAMAFPDAKFALNFPGIGNGKLARETVLPIIERLPDNVDIWERE